MTQDDMYDLVLGAAVVAIGYMLYKQHKAATPGNTGIVGPAINVPAPIEVQGDGASGYYYDLAANFDDIFKGAV